MTQRELKNQIMDMAIQIIDDKIEFGILVRDQLASKPEKADRYHHAVEEVAEMQKVREFIAMRSGCWS